MIGDPGQQLLVFINGAIHVKIQNNKTRAIQTIDNGACVKAGLPDHQKCGGKKERAGNESRLDRSVAAS